MHAMLMPWIRSISNSTKLLSSRASINLASTISKDTLASIQALPEVLEAVTAMTEGNTNQSSKIIDNLERASDVFEKFSPDGEERKAVLLLQSQALSDAGAYMASLEILDSILKMDLREDQIYNVCLAKVKTEWLNGSFEEAAEVANKLCDQVSEMDGANENIPLHQGMALNALAICRLSSANLKDQEINSFRNIKDEEIQSNQLSDLDESKEKLQMASTILRNAYQQGGSDKADTLRLGLAAAASTSNQGIAEMMFVLVKSRQIGMLMPYDNALKSWRNALNILNSLEDKMTEMNQKQISTMKSIRAGVFNNMAWGMLYPSSYMDGESKMNTLSEDSLKIASDYAGKALKIHDDARNKIGEEDIWVNESMGRTLNLVASCYERAGSAVTAEGLFQSAMGEASGSNNPLGIIDERTALANYSRLCSNWENRSSDSKMNQDRALELDDSLAPLWIGKSSLYSGLLLISMGDLH